MTPARAAQAYIDRYGLALVQIERGKKFPTHDGWNRAGGWFAKSSAAAAFYEQHPDHGIGVVLGPSGLCSLDVDHTEDTRVVLGEFGIDIDALAGQYPTVVGNPARFRIMFAVPPGADLGRHALSWPNKDDPTKRHTVFELRAGDVQDVLPPTIHPDTKRPYTWRTKPNGHFVDLPDELLAIWKHWDIFKPQAEALCPWLPKPTQSMPKAAPRLQVGASVIDQFIAAHSIDEMLARYGYKECGKRWLSPHSGTKLPGVVRLDDRRVFMHHSSDPLFCEHPLNAFDFWCHYEHGGDARIAVKAAAALLGLKPVHPPAPTRIEQVPLERYSEPPKDAHRLRPLSTFAAEIAAEFARDPSKEGDNLPWAKTHSAFRLRPHELTLWAGENGTWKSFVLGQIALDLAVAGKRVVVASLEMTAARTGKRLLQQALLTAHPTAAQQAAALRKVGDLLLVYDMTGRMRAQDMHALMRYSGAEILADHFVCDNLTKIISASTDAAGEQQGFVSVAHRIAIETGMHIHLVAHTRKPAGEDKPGKYDIRGSSTITDQADNVVMTWRNRRKEEAQGKGDRTHDEEPDLVLTVAKQRHGEFEGQIKLNVHRTSMQFIDTRYGDPVRYVSA